MANLTLDDIINPMNKIVFSTMLVCELITNLAIAAFAAVLSTVFVFWMGVTGPFLKATGMILLSLGFLIVISKVFRSKLKNKFHLEDERVKEFLIAKNTTLKVIVIILFVVAMIFGLLYV